MNWTAAIMGKISGSVAFSIGGDRIGMAVGAAGLTTLIPAFAAVSTTDGRLLALAEDAENMRRNGIVGREVKRVTRHGGFGSDDLGPALLRALMRRRPGAKWELIPPRVLVTCPHEVSLSAKNALIYAGAREVLVLDPAMAAAIGIGLDYELPRPQAVFVLERDWCEFAVIAKSEPIMSFQLPIGVETLLEDFATYTLASGGDVLDPETLYSRFGERGTEVSALSGDLGRPGGDSRGIKGAAAAFSCRLQWHYRRELETPANVKARGCAGLPVYFCGPYTTPPGMVALIGEAFERQVVVPREPEMAMLRGAQIILGELPTLLKRVKSRRPE